MTDKKDEDSARPLVLPFGITAAAIVSAGVFALREVLDRRNRKAVAIKLLAYHIDFLAENIERDSKKIEHLRFEKLEEYVDIYLGNGGLENSFKEYQGYYLRWCRDQYSPEMPPDSIEAAKARLNELKIHVLS